MKISLSYSQERWLSEAKYSAKKYFTAIWKWIIETIQRFFKNFWKGTTDFVASATIGYVLRTGIASDSLWVPTWFIAICLLIYSVITYYDNDEKDDNRKRCKVILYGVFLGIIGSGPIGQLPKIEGLF